MFATSNPGPHVRAERRGEASTRDRALFQRTIPISSAEYARCEHFSLFSPKPLDSVRLCPASGGGHAANEGIPLFDRHALTSDANGGRGTSACVLNTACARPLPLPIGRPARDVTAGPSHELFLTITECFLHPVSDGTWTVPDCRADLRIRSGLATHALTQCVPAAVGPDVHLWRVTVTASADAFRHFEVPPVPCGVPGCMHPTIYYVQRNCC